jgi:hypothetical protein
VKRNILFSFVFFVVDMSSSDIIDYLTSTLHEYFRVIQYVKSNILLF